MRKIEVGSKVKFSRAFLRSTAQFTGPVPFARGTVTDLKKLSEKQAIATVEWTVPDRDMDVNDVPTRSLVTNLALADALEVE